MAFSLPVAQSAASEPQACPISRSDIADALAVARSCGHAVEVLGRRTETQQSFAEADGSLRTTISAAPQRVRTADGAWTPIDTRLRATKAGPAPAATTVPVTFSPGGAGPLVIAETSAGPLSLTWPLPLPAPVLDGDAAVYPEVRSGVDLRVRALPTGFTYVLVVRTRLALADPFLQQVALTTDGPALREREGGGVEARDGDGKVVLSSGDALMWDSAGGTAAPGGPAARAGTVSSSNGPGDHAHSTRVHVATTGHDRPRHGAAP